MKACGLIVEYNPFHNGHVYHVRQSRDASNADCLIAVMSGSFLQRGEPAIIDKFHRTKAALLEGVDIVLELPYLYAVQSSDLFAEGAVRTLHESGVSSICFGSESGNTQHFMEGYDVFRQNEPFYRELLQDYLKQGIAFPEASRLAYQKIGLTTEEMDLSQPNNILGFSYVQTIMDAHLPITPLAIKRKKSNYHDEEITGPIASATSIRSKLLADHDISEDVAATMPNATIRQLHEYKWQAGCWHAWEGYFHLIHYRVMTMTTEELAAIHGVDEGLEYRIKKTARGVTSFYEWMQRIKTKRYTWTRLQRMFAHILTNTTKTDMYQLKNTTTVPYVRLLGMTRNGQTYLNAQKKEMNVPLVSKLSHHINPLLFIEEKASNAYYSMLPADKREKLRKQELQPPIMID
ncbi:nucleotidyltransferase [Lentibacillus cibarius]|uniref:tRNA(Met) cytidine acetate ligase n=1 Tax=Lentibacillus cibarius TaxID=2583219 RepID=A0A5S3QNW0_9BACI|nr:nucleotidyltransferase [Lentibacillus cibarius]TMN23479.1 nucleotidyltransferase [Lentibacillus cibarius]